MRRYAQSFIQPGIKLVDMCEKLEECNRRLVKENGLQVSTVLTIVQIMVLLFVSDVLYLRVHASFLFSFI